MHRLGENVTVILPAHNEARTVKTVVERVRASVPEAEIMVVDDGSTDETSREAEASGAVLVALAQNQGKGVALREGVAHARGDILVFIDADGQDDPAEIPAMLGALTPDVDLVLGSRFIGKFNEGAITRLNWLGTEFINTLGFVLFRKRITDPCAGFRAVRRSALERIHMKANGYDVEVDVVFGILRAGGKVVEVPAVRSARESGRSGLSSFKDGLRIARRMVQVRLEKPVAARTAREASEGNPISHTRVVQADREPEAALGDRS